VGAGETYEFWLDFLRSLVRRGLRGVHLVISDAPEGLRRALSEVLSGASSQRSRVHVMRTLLHRLPRHSQAWGVGLVRTIVAQPDQESARRHLEQVCAQLEGRVPQAAAFLREVAEDVLTSRAFPREHWAQIHSTNLVERVTRELARRCDAVGIFPTPHAVLRRVGAVLEEIHEEWLVTRRSFSPRSMHHLPCLSKGRREQNHLRPYDILAEGRAHLSTTSRDSTTLARPMPTLRAIWRMGSRCPQYSRRLSRICRIESLRLATVGAPPFARWSGSGHWAPSGRIAAAAPGVRTAWNR